MGILQRKVTFSKLIFEFKKYYLTTVKESYLLPEYRLFNNFKEYKNGDEIYSDENEKSESSSDEQKNVSPNPTFSLGE